MLGFRHALIRYAMTNVSASEIIDRLGGTSKTARLFEITAPSVSEWRSKGIPKARMMYLRAVFPEVLRLDESIVPPSTDKKGRK